VCVCVCCRVCVISEACAGGNVGRAESGCVGDVVFCDWASSQRAWWWCLVILRNDRQSEKCKLMINMLVFSTVRSVNCVLILYSVWHGVAQQLASASRAGGFCRSVSVCI
jgi:hypothetical protein